MCVGTLKQNYIVLLVQWYTSAHNLVCSLKFWNYILKLGSTVK